MGRARSVFALAPVALLATACSALIGVNDLFLDPNAATPGIDGGVSDALTDGQVPPLDGQVPTCNADLQTDPKNCGACGHDCSNGTCTEGLCVLGANLPSITHVVVRGGTVFASLQGGDGQIAACTTTGCGTGNRDLKDLAALRTAGTSMQPNRLAATDAFVFAAEYNSSNQGGFYRMTPTGSEIKKLPTGANLGRTYGIALGPDAIFWTTGTSPGAVYTCALPDCAGSPQTVATGETIELIAVASDGTIVWADNSGGELRRCASKTSCAPALLVPDFDGSVNDLVIDGSTVYWATTLGEILSCPTAGCTTPRKLVASAAKATMAAVAVSGTALYWSTMPFDAGGNNIVETEGSIRTCTLPDCNDPRTIASGQHDPASLAVDAKSVYWGNSGHRYYVDGKGDLVKAPR